MSNEYVKVVLNVAPVYTKVVTNVAPAYVKINSGPVIERIINGSIVYPFVNQTSFTYNHNLGRIVAISIYNLAGGILLATVTDDLVNHNYITITFTSPTSGRLLIQ